MRMAIRNLYRQARPFRLLGWSLFAVMLLGAPAQTLSSGQRLGGLLLALMGVLALDLLRLVNRSDAPPYALPSDSLVQRLQRVELLLVPGVLLILRLPLPLVFAVLGALVNANVALGGGRALPAVLLSIVFSVLIVALATLLDGAGVAGLLESIRQLPGAVGAAHWLPGAFMLLVFTVTLCNVGFCLTQKLDDHRRLWQDRLAALQPFVPHGLAQRLPAGQRRCWVSVVIIDLVEFTARSSPLPPELVTMVLDDLLDAVVVRAGRRGGTLDKFMGDGALLFFLPEPSRAAGARSALCFARELLTDLPGLNSRWSGFGLSEQLQLRVGIASGYCSVGECGTSDIRAYTIIGACVGLAERLQAASSADSMALCPLSARLLFEAAAEAADPAGRSPAPLPDCFQIEVEEAEIVEFSATFEALKGFARMRVFRPSAKVRTPLV